MKKRTGIGLFALSTTLLIAISVPIILQVVLGIILGVFVVLFVFFVLGLLSPFFVDLLVNNPRAKPGQPRPPIVPGRIYFFTFLEDGQVKIIVKGSKFIRAIMADPERIFTRTGADPKNAEYWGIRPALSNEHEDPVDQFELTWNPLSWWIHYMYRSNGAVWVGVPFFRELRIDRNVRVVEKKESGRVVLDEKTGLPILENIEDWSDHLRTKTFYWYFKVPSVDTKDNIKIGYTGFLKVQCVNPYLASFNIDHWDSALTKEVSTWVNNFNRAELYDNLIAAPDQTKNKMADFLLTELNRVLNPSSQTEKGIGMKIVDVNIIDQEPQLTEVQAKAQTAQWEAERIARATIVTAEADKKKRVLVSEGEAQAIVNKVKAAETLPEIALALAEFEAWKEIKGQALFNFKGGSGNSSLDAAILQKLTEISSKLNTGGNP